MSQRRSNLVPHTERRLVLSSFLSANNDIESLGSFRIPKKIHDEFGRHIPTRLRFKCNLIEWEGKYERKMQRICGMRKFMKYYEIKIYGAIQFDYYGEDEFRVKIFNNSALETNYRKMSPSKFLNNKKCQKWKKKEYVVDGFSLSYEKASALWSFNAFMNYVDYFEMKINNLHIDGRFPYLRLSKDFENLYKDWEDGGKLYLRFTEKTWDIDVKWIENTCVIGQQWFAFVEEIKLEVGDTLVLFRIPSSEYHTLNVCIFKGKDQIIDDDREKIGVFERSFLKVVSQHCLEEAVMFVPKTIKDKYGEKLFCINQLEIFGERYPVLYNSTAACLSQIDKMIQRFNLQKKETIVLAETNVLYARIYQIDGTEIDYENRSVDNSEYSQANWFWSVPWKSELDMDEDSGKEEEAVENIKVSKNMKSVNLGNGRYPLFVIVMKRETMNCNKLRLPERFLMECQDDIPHNIRLRLPNGRDIHVHFEKREMSLSPMSAMIKECRRLFGSTMIYSYEGNGDFLVCVLKEDFCEVDYFQFRTIPRAIVYAQDNINGVGWKFLLIADEIAFDFGQIVIPARFCRMFGKNIPESVSFCLSSGIMFHGRYVHEERQIIGLSDLFGLNSLEENDFLLFTYCGVGKFDIVILDNGKVQKNVDTNHNVPEAAAVEYSNNGPIDLEDTTATLIPDAELNEPELENNDGNAMVVDEMNDPVLGFSAIMTKCNVNNSSHGPYIPGYVNPENREWIAGENVSFRSENRVWDIGIVYSNGLARFSAGWNSFARDNELKKNETLVFNLLEGEGILVFDIDFPGRS